MANLGYVSTLNINGNELAIKDTALTDIVNEIIEAIGANNENIAERINDLNNRAFDALIKISSINEAEIASIRDGLYKIQYVTVTGEGDEATETVDNSAILIQKGTNQYLYKDGLLWSRSKLGNSWDRWKALEGGVTSVNGMTGAVTVNVPVTSVNGMTGTVIISVPTAVLSAGYTASPLSNEYLEPQPGDSHEEAISKLHKAILDNEEITAGALADIDERIDDLADVASSGDYNDLINTPSIPENLSDLANDEGFINASSLKTVGGTSVVGSGNIPFPVTSVNGQTGAVTVNVPVTSVNGQTGTVNLDVPSEIITGQIVGRMHRDNVSGTGNLTITGASGEGFSPNGITTAGKYVVVVYSWSETKTFGYNISFGSNSYTITTTDGTISDKRELTVSAGALWGGTVTTAVSAGTTIIVEIYKAEKITPALSVGTVALTNLYNDLDGKPTISSSTSSTSTTDIASSRAVKLAYDNGGVQSVNGMTGAVIITTPEMKLSAGYTASQLSNENLYLAPGDTYEEAFGKLEKLVNDNEIVNSAALVDLENTKVESVSINGGTAILPDTDKNVNLTIPYPVTSVNGQTGAVTIGETQLSKGSTGTGNAVTDISVSNHKITLVKGATYATPTYVQSAVATGIGNLVNGAPEALDTLYEIAEALNNDADLAGTLTNQIAAKYTKPDTGIPASDLANGVIPDIPVTSVNGMTGAVTVNVPVTSVNGQTGAVTITQTKANWNETDSSSAAYIQNKPTIPAAVTESTVSGWGFTKNQGQVISFNGATGAITYSAPVTSVNGMTGAVTINVPTNYKIDYSKQYLTFVALEDSTFTFNGNVLQYSIDDGNTWTELASHTASPMVTAGNKILWKQTGLIPTEYDGIGNFVNTTSTRRFNVEGNIMSLYYGDNFQNQTSLSGKVSAFRGLFGGNSNVVNAVNLVLPATTLTNYCYHNMFSNCTNLTTAPELPATTLATYCYHGMFCNCTNLTTAPELPATMLVDYCYFGMFQNCTSLTTAPELPATTLAAACYENMFQDCTNLNYIKCFATDISAVYPTYAWTYNVSSTGTFIKADDMNDWTTGSSGIPTGWTVYTESEYEVVRHYELDNLSGGVTSFNGQTGAINYTPPVTSVNGMTGAVTVNVPVTSVNGMTGAVTVSQVKADWNATSGDAQILNKPNISKEGSYIKISDYTTNGSSSYITFGYMGGILFNNVFGPTHPHSYINASRINMPHITADENTINIYANNNAANLTTSACLSLSEISLDYGFAYNSDSGSFHVGSYLNYSSTYNNVTTSFSVHDNNAYINDKPIATTDQIPSAVTESMVSEWGFTKNQGQVISFNGQTGAVTYTAPVTSVNGETGAVTVKANVQSDWNATTGDAVILNKPTIPAAVTESTVAGWGFTKNTGTLTTETQLSKGTSTGTGNAVTDINVSNHQITLVKGATYATQEDINESISSLVNSAPATLDTLNELATALGNDPNFATTVATQIGEKYTKPSTGIPASDLAAGVIPDVPVQSVNGQTGAVTINVGVTSFNGQTGAVTYTAPVTSVNGETGAVTVKANVQSDWNATTGDAVILNKPTIPTAVTESTVSSWGFTKNQGQVISFNGQTGAVTYSAPVTSVNGQTGAVTVKANVQSDWNATTGDAVILNKPTIPTVNDSTVTLTMNGNTIGTFTLNKSGNTTIDLGTVLTSHQSIKTINNQTITGTGNVSLNTLPTVSASDNGKVLMVVDGAWALVNPVTLYSGATAPNNAQGNNGDIYVQS